MMSEEKKKGFLSGLFNKKGKGCCDMEIVEETESACCPCCSSAAEPKSEESKEDGEK